MALTTIDDRGLKTPIDLLDNEKIRFGTSNDLEIYHWGHSVIENTNAAALLIASDETNVVNNAMSETLAKFIANGGVELYHDNAKVLYTHPNGAIVKRPSGGETELAVYGCEGNDAIILLASDDGDDNGDYFRLISDASHHVFYLQNYASGGWESNIKAAGNGAVELYYDNSKKFETYSGGNKSIGNFLFDNGSGTEQLQYDATNNKLKFNDNVNANFGNSNDLKIYHDGTYNTIAGANLLVRNAAANETLIYAVENGSAELWYDNSKKLETTSLGATIDRDLTLNHASGDTALRWAVGGTNKFSLYESSGTLRLYDNTNSVERLRFASDGKIGIGDINPTNKLVVYESATNSSCYLTIQNNRSRNAAIQFTTTQGSWYVGQGIGADVDRFMVYDSAERFSIDSSGNVGINESSSLMSNGKLTVKIDTNKHIGFSGTQGEVGNNPALVAYQDNGSLASMGFRGVDLRFATGSAERGRFTDNGLTFNGDTAAANALDDYEEGTWTFNVYSGTINNDGTTSGRVCKYRKVGGTVHFWFDFFQVNNNMELVGTVVISGLPFTPETEFHAHMNVATYNGSGTGTALSNYLENNARLVLHGNGTVSSIRHLWGFGSYPVTD